MAAEAQKAAKAQPADAVGTLPRGQAEGVGFQKIPDRVDSQGRRITRGAHAAKAQHELDTYNWKAEELARRNRQHAYLKHEFKPPSKMGRPSKYDDWMPQQVFDWLTSKDVIFTKKLVAAHLSVDVDTLNKWLAIHEDLRGAVAQGLAVQEAWLASQMADGMKYSASMYAVLKNLHQWKEHVEVDNKLSIGEAMQQQATGAKRIQWDRTMPDPLASRALPVVDVIPTSVLGSGVSDATGAGGAG